MFEDAFFIASFLVSSSHEMFVKEYRRFGGGSYRKISATRLISLYWMNSTVDRSIGLEP